MRIRAPLYFDRVGFRLRWYIFSPAGRGMRRVARMEWGQFRFNRGGHRLRYHLRFFDFIHWRAHRGRS